LARPGLGDASATAEVLEHVAHPVETGDHCRAGLDDVIESIPLSDDDVAPLSRLHDAELAAAGHLFIGHRAVQREEIILPPRLDPHVDDVHGRHLSPPTRLLRPTLSYHVDGWPSLSFAFAGRIL